MDPVTTAIVAVLSGIAGGAGQAAGGKLATDAFERFEKLKATIKRRFGADSEVAKSVENLEAKPESLGRKQTLEEEVKASGADRDPEVSKAAQELLDQLRSQPGGDQHIQNAVGNYIAQADRGGTARVDVDFSGERPKE